MRKRKRIFIFGASLGGRRSFRYLKTKYEIIGFLDNDSGIRERRLEGMKIFHPSAIDFERRRVSGVNDGSFDSIFICSRYFDEIREQLISLGMKSAFIRSPPIRVLEGHSRLQAARRRMGRAGDKIVDRVERLSLKIHNRVMRRLERTWIAYLLYPLVALLENPLALLGTLWRGRHLFSRNGRSHCLFDPKMGLNSLHYWAIAFAMRRFGKKGVCSSLGDGALGMDRFWFITRLSLFASYRFPCLVPLGGMLVWLFSHFIWIGEASMPLVFGCMVLASVSVIWNANAFCLQNYNALGWALLPFGMFALIQENWLLAAILWFGISFVSFTVAVIAGFFCVCAFLVWGQWEFLLSAIPCGAKLLVNVARGLCANRQVILDTSIAIGARKGSGRYAYHSGYKRNRLIVYFLPVGFLFATSSFGIANEVPWLFVFAYILFLVNSFLTRFADLQSISLLFASSGIATVLDTGKAWLLLPLWILLSPPPITLGLAGKPQTAFRVPVRKPYPIGRAIEKMDQFFSGVKKGSRVLVAFSDPKGRRENLFDGYRWILEYGAWSALKQDILFFPNWWAVYQSFSRNGPEWWGRYPEEVEKAVEQWRMDYVVVYEKDGERFSSEWEESGFEPVAIFDFASIREDLDGHQIFPGKKLIWHLLKVPSSIR